ncbi:uncharacterized protein Aud_000002 [Aspergillus udagawae]|uniref:Uncharacterized protein n=1 Tax=Aspergillus udagawae TaxID=91492 RepID=A0A8E0QK93_9EURO|nr:uncharacterized protein Aud_000002 [Aspergillus udagawae]GIC84188.1 hypothetical protein Aud_000002 [Aspergillus udagawae]
MELKNKDSTNYKSANDDWPTKNSNVLAATNQESLIGDGPSSDEWENFTAENYIQRLTALINERHRVIGPDLENTDQDEPDQEDFPAMGWTTIDRPINPLDEEYRTQWVSLSPNKEQPHKIPKTPRFESPQDDDEANQYAAWLWEPDRAQLAELEAH